MQYKLRYIVNSNSSKTAKKVRGLTIPNEVALFFEGCHFTIEKSGTCIIAYSGTFKSPTKKEVMDYTFQDCRCV